MLQRVGRMYKNLEQAEDEAACPEMLPTVDPLPHLICSPPVFTGGGRHEADQHDDA